MNVYFNLAEIKPVAQQLWQQFAKNKVWAFHGAMGAGKTTFVYALCSYLKVTDAVTSPTFAIINEYRSPVAGSIYHMDWYRLKDEEEAMQAGVEDCLLSGCLCFIEWPEKAAGLLSNDCLHIYMEVADAQTRRLYTAL